MAESTTARMPRADRGATRCTERDEQALRFLAEQRLAWEPDLALLLGPLAGQPWLSEVGLRSLVDRWRKAGWVTAERIWTARPRLVTITPSGAALATEDVTYRLPAEAHRLHLASVARARLWLMGTSLGRWGRLSAWQSERSWRQENYSPDGGLIGHPPDGVAWFERGPGAVAVEVELSPKNQPALDAAVTGAVLGFDAVLYFAGSPAIRDAVGRAVTRLSEAGRIPPNRVDWQLLPEDPSVIR